MSVVSQIIFMFSAVILSTFMQSVIKPSCIVLSDIIPSGNMFYIIILS